jgi:hypothetical protein
MQTIIERVEKKRNMIILHDDHEIGIYILKLRKGK